MRINEKLNLVVPIDQGEDKVIYVHSMPISREVFQVHYSALARTYARIFGTGFSALSGPRVAFYILRDVAKEEGTWEGPSGIQASLINEIHRLTNVVQPGKNGWETRPYQDAINRGTIDADDVDEVENALAFFTVVSVMMRRAVRSEVLTGAVRMWGALIVSLNCTEYAASLQTSKEAEALAEKKAAHHQGERIMVSTRPGTMPEVSSLPS